MMNNPRVGYILDLLEVRFGGDTPEEFDCLLDDIEAIL